MKCCDCFCRFLKIYETNHITWFFIPLALFPQFLVVEIHLNTNKETKTNYVMKSIRDCFNINITSYAGRLYGTANVDGSAIFCQALHSWWCSRRAENRCHNVIINDVIMSRRRYDVVFVTLRLPKLSLP